MYNALDFRLERLAAYRFNNKEQEPAAVQRGNGKQVENSHVDSNKREKVAERRESVTYALRNNRDGSDRT